MPTRTRVVAAVIVREGRVLVTRRPEGTHLGGKWEFPGGKVEAGEDDAAALRRELREETGVEVRVGALLERVLHDYPDKHVELLFHRCDIVEGEPEPIEVAEVAWADAATLRTFDFPPADASLIERLVRELE